MLAGLEDAVRHSLAASKFYSSLFSLICVSSLLFKPTFPYILPACGQSSIYSYQCSAFFLHLLIPLPASTSCPSIPLRQSSSLMSPSPPHFRFHSGVTGVAHQSTPHSQLSTTRLEKANFALSPPTVVADKTSPAQQKVCRAFQKKYSNLSCITSDPHSRERRDLCRCSSSQ